MKKLIAAVFILGLLLGGCQNNVAGVKTLLVTGETVNTAMNVYGELYRANALSADEIASVREKHAVFQLSFNKAKDLVGGDLSKLTPAEAGALASDLIIFIYSLKAEHAHAN